MYIVIWYTKKMRAPQLWCLAYIIIGRHQTDNNWETYSSKVSKLIKNPRDKYLSHTDWTRSSRHETKCNMRSWVGVWARAKVHCEHRRIQIRSRDYLITLSILIFLFIDCTIVMCYVNIVGYWMKGI
jgi:hypothetical protein